jgi:alkylation response protein AidB-like acyl-CoA dehydrogenase
MTGSRDPRAGEWAARARELGPAIQAHRDDCERQRRLTPALLQELRQAGIFNLTVPQAFGGAQVDITTFVSVIEELSRSDASVAWNAMIAGSYGFLADYLPEATAKAIFGGGDALVAGTLAPTGQADRVPGGYAISGRWSFGSGCHNANWMVVSCRVPAAGSEPAPQSPPELRLFLLPASECQIVDSWFTTGLRGTGSHDFEIAQARVAEEFSFPSSAFFSGPTQRSSTGYRQPFFAIAPLIIAAVSLGIARDAIESFQALARSKVPRRGTVTLSQQHTVHQRVGEAEARLRSSRVYLYDTSQQLDALRSHDPESLTEMIADCRLAAAHAARSCVEAVDSMFESGGGSSIYETSRLERCFRDVHVVTHHHMVSASNIEMVGQHLLGFGLQAGR